MGRICRRKNVEKIIKKRVGDGEITELIICYKEKLLNVKLTKDKDYNRRKSNLSPWSLVKKYTKVVGSTHIRPESTSDDRCGRAGRARHRTPYLGQWTSCKVRRGSNYLELRKFGRTERKRPPTLSSSVNISRSVSYT